MGAGGPSVCVRVGSGLLALLISILNTSLPLHSSHSRALGKEPSPEPSTEPQRTLGGDRKCFYSCLEQPWRDKPHPHPFLRVHVNREGWSPPSQRDPDLQGGAAVKISRERLAR